MMSSGIRSGASIDRNDSRMSAAGHSSATRSIARPNVARTLAEMPRCSLPMSSSNSIAVARK